MHFKTNMLSIDRTEQGMGSFLEHSQINDWRMMDKAMITISCQGFKDYLSDWNNTSKIVTWKTGEITTTTLNCGVKRDISFITRLLQNHIFGLI